MKKHLLLIPTFLMLSVVSNAQIDGLLWTNGQGSYKCTTNEDGNLALMGDVDLIKAYESSTK